MKYKVTTATEAHQVFDMLGIKNVSTRRQKQNGTCNCTFGNAENPKIIVHPDPKTMEIPWD